MHINPVIKQFLYDELLKHPHDSVKIPSERELCAMFQSSRPTIRKALAELIAEGVLIVRHGNGTYTCPSAANRHQQMHPQRTLGILLGYGSSMLLDSYYWAVANAAQLAFGNGELLHLPFLQIAGDGPSAVEEIRKYRLDALLWLHPDERRADVIAALQHDGLPVCCVGRNPGGAPAAMLDYRTSGRHLARYFLEAGCHYPLLVVDRSQPVHAEMVQGFTEELIAGGETPDFRRMLLDIEHLSRDLEQLKSNRVDFDGAFSFGTVTGTLQLELIRIFGREKFAALEFVVVNAVHRNWPECAYLDIDGARLGEIAGRFLAASCQSQPFDQTQLHFAVKVIKP